MSELVKFPANGRETTGYLALPKAPGPGVVVIQEWWGLVPHIESIADRFASAGFVALAPDLYHGARAKSPDEAGKLMMSLRIDEAARDLAGAVNALGARYEVVSPARGGPKKVGSIGFCMGGALSLYAACQNSAIGACVVFYGGHPNVKPDLASLQAPVLGIYAGKDGFVTPEVVKALGQELTSLEKRHEFHTYPAAQHAFFNDQRPEVYEPVAARDAWAKTIDFLRRELTT